MTTTHIARLALIGLSLLLLFLLFGHSSSVEADMTSGPPDAPVCLTGTAGTPYLFTYAGQATGQGGRASLNFGGATYYSGTDNGTAASVYVEHTYAWATQGTYWVYGVGAPYMYTPTWCGNTGCPGESGGFPGAGTLTGPNGSATGGPAFCKVIITPAPAAQPDLTASSITPTSATVGTAVTFNATIANIGTGTTGTGFVDLFQLATNSGGSNATDIGSYSNPARAAGSSNAAVLSPPYTFPSPGTYYVRACADKSSSSNSGTIAETNENNNCGPWTAITVSASAPLAASCSVSPTSITVGQSATWSASASGGSGLTWQGPASIPAWQQGYPSCSSGETIGSSCSTEGSICWTGWGACAPYQTNGGPGGGACGQPSLVCSATGGPSTYTYSWSGTDNLSGSDSSVVKSYSTPGTKTGTVTVTSGSSSVTETCSLNVSCPSGQTWNGTSCVTDPPTCPAGQTWNGSSCVNTGGGSLSCTVSDTSVNVGETVTYSASGGSEPYTWTPADSHPHNYGSAAHVNRTFTASGNFGMTVSKPSYTSGNCPVVVVGTPACTSSSATIEADPDRVRKGDDTIVTWSASGGGACALSCVVTENGSTLSTDASGSEERTINEQTVYRISCGGGGEDEVVVNLIPGFIEF